MIRAVIMLLVSIAACHRELKEEEHVALEHHVAVDAGVELEQQRQDHGIVDQHAVTTVEPAEEEGRWFGPDGGVVFEGKRHWGGTTTEEWLKKEFGSDERVDLKGSVSVKDDTTGQIDASLKKESDSGGFLLGVKLGAALLVALAIGAFLLWRKFRKAVPIP